MDKKQYFIDIFEKANKKFENDYTRLAAEGWKEPWQVLIVTIMSAQSKDETTIVIGEELFKKYPSLNELADADYEDVLKIFKSLNYNKTKAKHVISSAQKLRDDFNGAVPSSLDDLISLPGVGRKTANLVMGEVFNKPAICVDTHVHRISNIFGFVKTKNPDETEKELMKFVPEKYWNSINRVFVLWGKSVAGWDKNKLLDFINS